jgi:hypothetical protein
MRVFQVPILGLIFLQACGGGYNPDKAFIEGIPSIQNLSGEKFEILSNPNTLTFGNGSISGIGTIRFAEGLGGADTDYHYKIIFTVEDQGEVTFITHAHNDLSHGVELKFRRETSNLEVNVQTRTGSKDWSQFFVNIDPSEELRLSFDAHNSEALTHIIIWNDQTDELLVNSASIQAGGSPGRGEGQRWGLKISQATVSSTNKGQPKAPH